MHGLYPHSICSGFGGFGVVVNPGMYRVTIMCKKPRKCPKVIKTVDVDAQRKLAHSLSGILMVTSNFYLAGMTEHLSVFICCTSDEDR